MTLYRISSEFCCGHCPQVEYPNQVTLYYTSLEFGSGHCPLVEATGIEPVSENPLTQLSSWTVCLLEFPITDAARQASDQSSPFLLDRFKSEPPMQVHHYMTLRFGSW